ncbi:uncharacterized protein LOC103310757 isoform X1 [Acyrthosiphon pisum]|uniref:Uncharacterized protein n=1 Tax=Acyrthosiphon pisum TaxID=7029 RepID=A0A8R2D5T1_ACYPI|nr:uncharacterized protein LOC103310757 isoform X1 [Acyrthosiphon pisum]|eukprot:XP_016662810.1 PREDICTED: uncharacterized protein LOC103310757 isoform X1 [Acyrthosiphon pisum]
MSVNNDVQIEKWSCINSFFQQLFDIKAKSETGLSFKCLLCLPKQKIVSASQSSNANLRTHVKLVHSHRLNDFNIAFKKRNCDDISTSKHSKQLKLREVGHNSVKKLTQTEFNNANLKLIINTVSPFSLIEHPAFIDYCKLTSSKIPVSRRTLMRDVEILFNSLIEELKMELNTVQYVCLTADCWTVFHKAYIGVTVHWLDSNLERHNKALACRRMLGRHTYDNIAEILDRIVNEFNLQNKITLIVTDNASNFVKAFRIFNENSDITGITTNEDENEEVVRSVEIFDILDNAIIDHLDSLTLPPHQRCAAHTLNLIATVDILAADNDVAFKRISRRVFGKCQTLFNRQ